MGTTSEKLTYLNETKSKIKDNINLTGVNITNEDTFRSYSEKLKQGLLDVLNNGNDYLYNNFPQTTGTGTNITLNNTLEAPIKSELLGNTNQDGTPTPDAPVEVKNATGGQVVKVSNGSQEQSYEINLGKNLFDKNTTNIFNAYVASNGIISYASNRTIYIPVKSGETYTIQKLVGNGNLRFGYTTNTPVVGNQTILGYQDTNVKTLTTTAPTNGNYLCISIYRDADSSFTISEVLGGLQIEQGSQATSYAPYFTPIELCKIDNYQDNIRKSTGANLFNKDDIVTGSYIDASGSIVTASTVCYSNYIKVQPNTTYTIVGRSSYHSQAFYDENKNFIIRDTNQETFTTGDTTYYIRINGVTSEVGTYMLNKGSTALPYEPYGSKGKWLLTKKIGKVVLNGNEWWDKGATQVSDNSYYYTAAYDSLIGWNTYLMYCNYFEQPTRFLTPSYNSNGSVISGPNPSSTSNSRLRILIPNSTGATTTTNFKNWIIANTPVVYYVLNTPTVEEITDSTLINDLNNLEDAKSYNGTTNITITAETPADIKITALKNE